MFDFSHVGPTPYAAGLKTQRDSTPPLQPEAHLHGRGSAEQRDDGVISSNGIRQVAKLRVGLAGDEAVGCEGVVRQVQAFLYGGGAHLWRYDRRERGEARLAVVPRRIACV
jgi:hypothetical protein